MIRGMKYLSLAAALLCIFTAHFQLSRAQQRASIQAAAAASPVAFVYVSTLGSGVNVIHAFSADATGRLTPIKGSPFADNVTSMAVNGKYLFALNGNGTYIARFLIESNGALQWIQSTDFHRYSCYQFAGPLVLDHTGKTLYNEINQIPYCPSNVIQSFAINTATSDLTFLGSDSTSGPYLGQISFIGNNVYAYAAACATFGSEPPIEGFQRLSNGMLVNIGITAPIPAAKNTADFYCPGFTAADPANHLAVSLQAINERTHNPAGPPVLASFTADSSGNLATTNTYANMPAVAGLSVSDLKMSPSGKLLAVGQPGGLQVFHFNGNKPVTRYTGLLTKDDIDQCFWDNDNHLYGVSLGGGKLYVFTVTPTSATQAPGSPYTLPGTVNIIVQPRTSAPPS